MDNNDQSNVDFTIEVVTAYLSNNQIEADKVPSFIASVHAAVTGLGQPVAEPEEEFEKPSAAQIRKSISDDGLISFVDGKTYKSLKRHLSTNGMTPAEYRERFGLKPNYPMVSPAYSRARSELAKSMGLGSKGRQAKAAPKAAPARKPRAPKAAS